MWMFLFSVLLVLLAIAIAADSVLVARWHAGPALGIAPKARDPTNRESSGLAPTGPTCRPEGNGWG